MNDLLPKILDTDYVLPKIFFGLMLAILFWSFFGPTEPEYDAEGTKVGIRRARSARTKNRQEKEAFLAKMLAKEKRLTEKYRHKSKHFDDDDQGGSKGRQAWRQDKERTERYYSRFKGDDTNRSDSVKVQLKNSLKQLDEDRPR